MSVQDLLPVLVTGASGTIGGRVVHQFLAAGRPVRAGDLTPVGLRPGRLPAPASPGDPDHAVGATSRPDAVRFDYTDPATWRDAFAGVEVMFCMRPPQLSNVGRDIIPALAAARAAGVRHVVLLSLQGADRIKVVPHAKIETWLRGSGMAWTFVRPSFFCENLTAALAPDIRERDEIVVPAGTGAVSFVAADDVAAVVAAALSDPAGHAGRAWTPTGPKPWRYGEVAQVLSTTLSRPIRYRKPGAIAYARHARSALGMPWPMVAVTTGIHTTARLGLASGVTGDVAAVTGREPLDLPDCVRANVDAWRRP